MTEEEKQAIQKYNELVDRFDSIHREFTELEASDDFRSVIKGLQNLDDAPPPPIFGIFSLGYGAALLLEVKLALDLKLQEDERINPKKASAEE